MTDFKQAIKWLEEGKAIKRTNWRIDGEVHLILKEGEVFDCYGHHYKFDYDDIKTKNWKLYFSRKTNRTNPCKYCGKPTHPFYKDSKVCDKCKSKLAKKAVQFLIKSAVKRRKTK